MKIVDLSSRFVVLPVALIIVLLLNGSVIDADNSVDIISLTESQYCFVNHGTIRVSDNFTSDLQDIVNKTENVIISTTINSTVIFIAPSNGTRCSTVQHFISETLFVILMVILAITILVAVANVTLHLMVKELHTMTGVLVTMLCGIVIVVATVSITTLTYSFMNDGSEHPTACVVFASVLSYLTLLYQAIKLVILFQFAYLMYKSYKLHSQDTIDKRCLLIKFVIFALASSMLCLLLAILIDFAVTGKFYSNRGSLCLTRQIDLDDLSVFRFVSLVEFALFTIAEVIVFIIGFALYYVVNKSCFKTISTNFRIAIALATTIGVSNILLVILQGTKVSDDYAFPAVSSGTLIEQLFLFILFASSKRVRNGLRKMFVKKTNLSSTNTTHSKETMEEHKELYVPLVAVHVS